MQARRTALPSPLISTSTSWPLLTLSTVTIWVGWVGSAATAMGKAALITRTKSMLRLTAFLVGAMTGSLLNSRITSPDKKVEANDRHRRGLQVHPQHHEAAEGVAKERLLRGSWMQ